MENRIGKINISMEVIENGTDEVSHVFSMLKFIPLRVEHMYTGIIEMIGYSHMFKEIEKGLTPIEYKLQITKKEDGTLTIEVKDFEEL